MCATVLVLMKWVQDGLTKKESPALEPSANTVPATQVQHLLHVVSLPHFSMTATSDATTFRVLLNVTCVFMESCCKKGKGPLLSFDLVHSALMEEDPPPSQWG